MSTRDRVAAADSQDECLLLVKEAIELHIEGMRQDGDPVPESGTVAATTYTTAG